MNDSENRKKRNYTDSSLRLDVTYTKQIQKKNKTYHDGTLIITSSAIELQDASAPLPISRMDISLANNSKRLSIFYNQYDRAVSESHGLIQGVFDDLIIALDNPPNIPGRFAHLPIKSIPPPPPPLPHLRFEKSNEKRQKFSSPVNPSSTFFHPATVALQPPLTFHPITEIDQLMIMAPPSMSHPTPVYNPENFALRILNTVYREIYDSIVTSSNSVSLSSTFRIVLKDDKIRLESVSRKFPDFFNVVYAKSKNEIFVFRAIQGSHPHSNRAQLVAISSNSSPFPETTFTEICILPNLHCDIRLIDFIRSPNYSPSTLITTQNPRVIDNPLPPLSIDIIEDYWHQITSSSVSKISFTSEQLAILLAVRDWLTNPSAKPIICIEGVFGSGKSTLLAACMFLLGTIFDAHQLDINNLSRILLIASTNAAVDATMLKLLTVFRYKNFARIGIMDKISSELFDFSGCISSGQRPVLSVNEWKNNRRIIGATAATASDLGNLSCPFVFIDEGSQLTEIASLLPLLQTKAVRILVLGDSHQLSQPCAESISSSILTVFSSKSNVTENKYLNVQFRCQLEIANFCAKHFYPGRPIETAKMRIENAMINDPLPSLSPISIKQHNFRASRDAHSFSLKNPKEAELIVDFIQSLNRSVSVAIISFYCAQAECLVEALQRANPESNTNIPVHTVDSFQGSEADIVLISLVASDGGEKSEKFLANKNRLNVALTRAIHKVVIFGHCQIFEKISIFSQLKNVAKLI